MQAVVPPHTGWMMGNGGVRGLGEEGWGEGWGRTARRDRGNVLSNRIVFGEIDQQEKSKK